MGFDETDMGFVSGYLGIGMLGETGRSYIEKLLSDTSALEPKLIPRPRVPRLGYVFLNILILSNIQVHLTSPP